MHARGVTLLLGSPDVALPPKEACALPVDCRAVYIGRARGCKSNGTEDDAEPERVSGVVF
jgi:hypothetical protein